MNAHLYSRTISVFASHAVLAFHQHVVGTETRP